MAPRETSVPVVDRTARAEWQPRLSSIILVFGKLPLNLLTPCMLVLWKVQTDRLELFMMYSLVGLRFLVLLLITCCISLHRVWPALRHLLTRTRVNSWRQQVVISLNRSRMVIAPLTRLLKLTVLVCRRCLAHSWHIRVRILRDLARVAGVNVLRLTSLPPSVETRRVSLCGWHPCGLRLRLPLTPATR